MEVAGHCAKLDISKYSLFFKSIISISLALLMLEFIELETFCLIIKKVLPNLI